ncbi:MAG TPA: molybdate ABC transporter substrate-binding protein [Candidatus Blautia merdigallinarum]|uniref:Molybdate ABC transporter substrate-binding protein n=1 Tax=Candidatus Blautia merdigallinarum TaxID=2838495 RepID=A0A9D2N547_9FIRM|nr:molybdate ABC transporter substrate-binding protein [Candidatus Blautia merdigallinarum]
MKKRNLFVMATLSLGLVFATGCGGSQQEQTEEGTAAETSEESTAKEAGSADQEETTNILIAAAASLEYSLEDELIPMFEEAHPEITVEGTYDSSGKLQTQIEEGLEADIFFSAATAQMDALTEEGLIKKDTVTDLLENKIVLIAAKGEEENYTSFEDIAKAETPALGDPASVPAGQYAQEALTNLGLWEEVSAKASFGTNVTEVLNWVAEGSAQAGIVYATDAATQEGNVTQVAEAPEGSLAEPVLYPVAMVENTQHQEEAQLFLDFLQSDEAAQVFESYGFTMNR